MAHNKGGDGRGESKVPLTPKEQNEIRQATKTRPKGRSGGNGASRSSRPHSTHVLSPTVPRTRAELAKMAGQPLTRPSSTFTGHRPSDGTLMDGVRQDRAEWRKQRREALLGAACKATLKHLQRYANQQQPNKNGKGTHPRWGERSRTDSTRLLELYFHGDANDMEVQAEIDMLESGLPEPVLRRVREEFAGTCFFRDKVVDTIGQAQPWYDEVYAERQRHLTQQRIRAAEVREVMVAA